MRLKIFLVVLTVVAAGEQYFATGSHSAPESARDRLARRERCMKLENAKALPACREFLNLETSEDGKSVITTIEFCKDLNPVNTPCKCSPNGVDVECTYRICGYSEGYYRDSNLPRFATLVAEVLTSWRSKSLVSTRFVGFADGTAWGDKKIPKPESSSEFLKLCMLRATREHAGSISTLNKHDHLDAELALLRGCALEEELTANIKGFEFDSTPTFSFEAREIGVSDPRARAAELSFVVANSCGRLLYDQKR